MTEATNPIHGYPLAADPSWQRFKDALIALIAHAHLPGGANGKRLEFLVRALAGLDATDHDAGELASRVYEGGIDAGRHVYAKKVVGDDPRAAAQALSQGVTSGQLGTLEVRSAFHRTMELNYAPPGNGGPARRLCVAFVAGLAQGTFSEALNSPVTVTIDGERITVELGRGRDVNMEVQNDG